MYAGDHDPAEPLISPLFGDLRGLPPLLMYAGADETRFADRARRTGVPTALHVGEGLFHCYPACAPLFPAATRALAKICAFAREVTALRSR